MESRPAPPRHGCRICTGSGEDAYGQRCVCTYNKDRADPVKIATEWAREHPVIMDRLARS